MRTRERFSSVILDGHKGLAFEIPFSPETRWQLAPVKLRPGRRGYRVRGTLNDAGFESVAVPRSRTFFVLLVTDEMRDAGRLEPGDTVNVSLEPAG
ncbi:MAG TPA: DUF1905 domain-containing protein [Thermoanaerobaculia bacterium]